MALLAKELNPFSISPIMFCQIATGSLLLSAIGVLQHDREGSGAPPFVIPHCCGKTVNIAGVDLPLPGSGSLLRREKPCHRRPPRHTILPPIPGNNQGE